MPRRIRFTFPDEDISAVAELLDEYAPETCEAIWNALPLEDTARHGIYSGSEVLMFIPSNVEARRENSTSRVHSREVGYYSFEEQTYAAGRQPRAEIAWFYDTDVEPRMPDGPVAVSVFARFDDDEGWKDVKKLCFRMRMEGAKRLRLEKVEANDG